MEQHKMVLKDIHVKNGVVEKDDNKSFVRFDEGEPVNLTDVTCTPEQFGVKIPQGLPIVIIKTPFGDDSHPMYVLVLVNLRSKTFCALYFNELEIHGPLALTTKVDNEYPCALNLYTGEDLNYGNLRWPTILGKEIVGFTPKPDDVSRDDFNPATAEYIFTEKGEEIKIEGKIKTEDDWISAAVELLLGEELKRNPEKFLALETKYFDKNHKKTLKTCLNLTKQGLKERVGERVTEKDVTYAQEMMTKITEKCAKEKSNLKQEKKAEKEAKKLQKSIDRLK